LGTIPFVMAGAQAAGARGVFFGSVAGGVIFGLGALWMCYVLIGKLAENDAGRT
jgi:hypothetical protein